MRTLVNKVLRELDALPLSRAVGKGLRVAETIGDKEIAKWCRLELAGYWHSNSAMSDDVVVPEYRAAIGQHVDIYGRVLMLPPNLHFVNETRLRNGIEELEALGRTQEVVVIHGVRLRNRIFQS